MSTRRSPGVLVQVAILSLLLGLGAQPLRSLDAEEGPGNPKTGRNLFVNKGCLRCHSIWGAKIKKGPNLASVGMGRNLYELCASVWSHWSRMNAVIEQEGTVRVPLTPSDFRHIIAYLYYLNYNAEPAVAATGKALFRGKGCLQCHADNPLQAKGKAGRAVYEMQEFQDPVSLAVAVWNHGADMFRAMSQRNLSWPHFEGKEVAHLVAYIRANTMAPKGAQMALPGDPMRGQELFKTKACAGCHVTGSRPGIDLAASGAAVSLSELVAALWDHHPRMSKTIAATDITYPKLSKSEMEDLLAYIYWLKAYGLAGSAAAGHELYQSKQCASCHSASDRGKPIAPNLMKSETTASTYALLAAIWNHGPRMETLLRERNLEWPVLDGEEMRNLIAYLRGGDRPR